MKSLIICLLILASAQALQAREILCFGLGGYRSVNVAPYGAGIARVDVKVGEEARLVKKTSRGDLYVAYNEDESVTMYFKVPANEENTSLNQEIKAEPLKNAVYSDEVGEYQCGPNQMDDHF